MITLEFPSVRPASVVQWGQDTPTLTSVSTFNGSTQVIERPGARWRCEMQWTAMTPSDARVMSAWLASMRGAARRVRMGPPQYRGPQGTARGVLTVSGANQTGAALSIAGATAGATLLPGDYIEAGEELKMVVASSVATSGGAMVVSIEPPLRFSPPNGSLVIWDRPQAYFRLVQSSWAMSYGAPLLPQYGKELSLQFVESWT